MSSHRPFGLPAAVTAAVLLLAAMRLLLVGRRGVRRGSQPPAAEAAFCQALAKELPDTVAGLARSDPEPGSELTMRLG